MKPQDSHGGDAGQFPRRIHPQVGGVSRWFSALPGSVCVCVGVCVGALEHLCASYDLLVQGHHKKIIPYLFLFTSLLTIPDSFSQSNFFSGITSPSEPGKDGLSTCSSGIT